MKWYKKATVQTALVHAAINLITAAIAIVAIIFSSKFNELQIDTQKGIFNKQYVQDSIKNALEIELLIKQISLVENQNHSDSIQQEKSFQISKAHYDLLRQEKYIYDSQNKEKMLKSIIEYNVYIFSFDKFDFEKFTIEEFEAFFFNVNSKLQEIIQNPYLIQVWVD